MRNSFVLHDSVDGAARGALLAQYRRHLLEDLPELRGRTLYRFCAPPGGLTAADRPHVCHGQVLAELADALPEPPR